MTKTLRLNKASMTVFLAATALSGCATFKPPEIAYDTPAIEATLLPEPERPVRIVERTSPLPLPGQLKPINGGDRAPESADPAERVSEANAAARMEPVRDGFINAVQLYPYTEGALYQVYASPGQITDIALQPGEKLTSVSAGDTVRWVIGDTVSGTGDSERTHVLVKPFAPGLKTNLVITTDRRAYHLQLESTEKTAMAAVSWTYPSDQLLALRRQNAAAQAALPVASNVALDNIRFRYAITGDNPPWKPLRAFDDDLTDRAAALRPSARRRRPDGRDQYNPQQNTRKPVQCLPPNVCHNPRCHFPGDCPYRPKIIGNPLN